MTQRTVKEVVVGRPSVDGAGVHLNRVLSRRTAKAFDPFLMLDSFDSRNPDDYVKGFPMHPHRGIETVTYLLSGNIEHQDSMGNKGVITDGACQWMTAGGGIIHQEMPRPAPYLLGLQLWINLPVAQKMMAPKYRGLEADAVPIVDEGEEVGVRVLCGSYQGVEGAMQADYVPVVYLDVDIKPNGLWQWPTNPDDTVFI